MTTTTRAKRARPEDVEIGARIRRYRTLRGITQEQLAETIGVTFQQVQKYEKGMNRVSGSRMIDIARALRATVAELLPAEVGEVDSLPAFSPSGLLAAKIVDTVPERKRHHLINMLKAFADAIG